MLNIEQLKTLITEKLDQINDPELLNLVYHLLLAEG